VINKARKKIKQYRSKIESMGDKLDRFNNIYWLNEFKFLTQPFKEYVEHGTWDIEIVRFRIHENFLLFRDKIIEEHTDNFLKELNKPLEKQTINS
jgi:hypothetical protein